jgi:hypothetical protein
MAEGEGIIVKVVKDLFREVPKDVGTAGAEDLARHEAPKIAQGFTERQFKRFALKARQLVKEARLPEGDLVVQGSRAKSLAKNASDIDVALRVDDRTFFDMAEKVLARARPETRLRASMLRRINVNGQLASFDLGTDFTRLRRAMLDPESPYKVQFSVIRKGGKFDNGPFIPLN